MGALAVVSVAFTSANRGLSAIVSLIHSPTRTSTPLSRNGTRQPQLRKADSEVTPPMRDRTPLESRSPIGTPTCGQLALSPRRDALPDSRVIRTAPPHSPPRPSPWMNRRATSRIGAHTPMVACVGSRPIANVALPISNSVTTRTFFRPSLSP